MPNWITRQRDRLTGADKLLAAAADMQAKSAATFDHVSLFLSGKEVPAGGGGPNVDAAYSNSWVAYSCIKRLATDAAGIPLRVLADPDDTDSVVPASHRLAYLLANPSPLFSSNEFVQWIITWLNLRGEYFVTFDNPMAPREMIFWHDPRKWKETLQGGRPASWTFTEKGQRTPYPIINVLNHRLVNPANPWRGQAPIEAAALAYAIDVGASTLQSDVIQRGGERSIMFQDTGKRSDKQLQQVAATLRGRRARQNATVSQDVFIPGEISLLDPKFFENDDTIGAIQKMQPENICAVYGLSKSMLGMEAIDQFATFKSRVRVYFTQTLIPQLTGVERSFDRYFNNNMPSAYHGFARFDYTQVEALIDDVVDRFTAANLAHLAGLPWSVCNERFKLGLDLAMVPGADVVMVQSSLAPLDKLIEEWDNPAPDPVPPIAPVPPAAPVAPPEDAEPEADPEDPEDASTPDTPAKARRKDGLTQALINKRAGDSRARIQRQMRLTKAEKTMRGDWRKMLAAVNAKAREAIGPGDLSPVAVRNALTEAFRDLPEKAASVAGKFHELAAREGAQAITEIVTGKMSDAELHVWKTNAPWRPQTADFIKQRQNLVKGMADDLFDDVTDHAVSAVMEGASSSEVLNVIAERLGSGPGGGNRAVTIARTEIGTAYSVSRDAEMKAQGFDRHQWLTAGDDLVRDGEFSHTSCDGEVRSIGELFPCGLAFPMAPGGEAGNVINCRCETIPLVAGMEE